jgi:hypothetical protein
VFITGDRSDDLCHLRFCFEVLPGVYALNLGLWDGVTEPVYLLDATSNIELNAAFGRHNNNVAPSTHRASSCSRYLTRSSQLHFSQPHPNSAIDPNVETFVCCHPRSCTALRRI